MREKLDFKNSYLESTITAKSLLIMIIMLYFIFISEGITGIFTWTSPLKHVLKFKIKEAIS